MSENGKSLIDLRAVIKDYPTAAGDFRALYGIDLTVAPGEFVAVHGKSGSGKSTLVNMISGIDRPTGGEVYVDGTTVHTLPENEMARWRGMTIGIVFQFFQLMPTLTVLQNVMYPMALCGLYSKRERRERALDLLDQVHIAEHAHKLPSEVSGGQQQRVAIARALANDPPLVLADEPTGNLDWYTAGQVFELFEALAGTGKTVVMVTHDDELAARMPRMVTIADGLIVGDSTSNGSTARRVAGARIGAGLG
jgi:putative ABC transport system ATP-binding protein